MGGLWGAKGSVIMDIKSRISKFFLKNDEFYRYNRRYDQYFLYIDLWRNFIHKSYLAHSSVPNHHIDCQPPIKFKYFPHTHSNNIVGIGLNPLTYMGETINVPYSKPKVYDLQKIKINEEGR